MCSNTALWLYRHGYDQHGRATGADDLLIALFGENLNGAVATDRDAATCQAAVLKAVQKLLATKAKLFLGCEKAGLAGKPSAVVSALHLGSCFATLAADADGKIMKALEKVQGVLSDKCAGVNLATALPGWCASAGDMAVCLDRRVECHICRMFSEIAHLITDSDRFDDDTANNSCN